MDDGGAVDAAMTQTSEASAWVDRLTAVGRSVRGAVVGARGDGAAMAQVVAQEGGDTIFAIDRCVEPVIEREVAGWPGACKPLLLIAEGLGAEGRRAFGEGRPRYRLIVDPIDGTRNIMYDKRSAWFIAAVCEGEAESVADAIASVMVEIPTSKAGYADTFTATRDGGVCGKREPVSGGGAARAIVPRPSSADTLLHGFAQVSNFFPGHKVIAAELMQRIVDATIGDAQHGIAAVFDDQYITTAGQFVELMLGHDRFCCDLRPLFYQAIARQHGGQLPGGLECHPYDVAGMLAAQRAGVILTDGFGRPLRPPMDVHTGVHWCGYANGSIRRAVEPIIQQFFAERGVTP